MGRPTNRTPEEIARGLTELAERCEKATGPDRELDGEVDRFLNLRPKDGDYDADEKALWRIKNGWSGLLVRGDGFARDSFCAKTYTASLDAAMTMVPEGARFIVDSDGCHCRITKPSDKRWPWNGYAGLAGTPALALTAACLRALAVRSHLESHKS